MYGTIEQEPNKYCSQESAECSATALNNGDDEWRYEVVSFEGYFLIRVFDETDTFVGWM
jgi:hypothetical protein